MTAAPWFILPLMAVIIVEYGLGLLIERGGRNGSGSQKIFLHIGILFPLSLLVLFKYASFFHDAAVRGAVAFGLRYPAEVITFIIPLGISYYSFQSISYVIEVHRGAIRAERHFGMFALYLLFFPKIIAGPIERPSLIRQFHERHDCDYRLVTDGMRTMAGGFFKKLVIADRVAIVVKGGFGPP